MFGSFGWMELLLILLIVLIIFGAGRLPQLGEGLGRAIKGFKKSVHEAEALDEDVQGNQSPSRPSVDQQMAEAPEGTAAPDEGSQPPRAAEEVRSGTN